MFSIFKNIFSVVCLAITLVLIFELLHEFVAERPTTTAKLKKQLEITDLPDVVVCMDPGFDSKTLEKYGYDGYSYFMGTHGWVFVGWNGHEDQNKSSHEILKETLLFPEGQGLLFDVKYAETLGFNYEDANVTFMNLIYPFGCCMVIRPPSNKTSGPFNPKYLYVELNNAHFKQLNFSSVKLKVFLMDRRNSPKQIPDEMEMLGDQIGTGLELESSTYRTKISRSEHVTGDPLFNCAVYTRENSYEDCIRKSQKDLFQRHIGCQPPLFADNQGDMGNQKFNVSYEEHTYWEINTMFEHLLIKDLKTGCKIPCTKSKYTTRLSSVVPYSSTQIFIVFDETVDVTRSRFSINANTFLTKLGGLIGVGRTLLWVLISLLAICKVTKSDMFDIFSDIDIFI